MVLVVRVEQSRSFFSCPGWVVARRDAASALSIAGSSQSEEDEAGSQRVPTLEPSAELARLKKYGGPLSAVIPAGQTLHRSRLPNQSNARTRFHPLARADACISMCV